MLLSAHPTCSLKLTSVQDCERHLATGTTKRPQRMSESEVQVCKLRCERECCRCSSGCPGILVVMAPRRLTATSAFWTDRSAPGDTQDDSQSPETCLNFRAGPLPSSTKTAMARLLGSPAEHVSVWLSKHGRVSELAGPLLSAPEHQPQLKLLLCRPSNPNCQLSRPNRLSSASCTCLNAHMHLQALKWSSTSLLAGSWTLMVQAQLTQGSWEVHSRCRSCFFLTCSCNRFAAGNALVAAVTSVAGTGED